MHAPAAHLRSDCRIFPSMEGKTRQSPARQARSALPGAQAQLVRTLGERVDHELHVLVEGEARVALELLAADSHVVTVDARREARLLQLLLHGLGREPLDAG